MKKYSLTKMVLGSQWLEDGIISLSSGSLEESFTGPNSENFFSKLSDLLTKLPNLFDGQVLLSREEIRTKEISGYKTKLYFFEKVQKPESYSHIQSLFSEIKLNPQTISHVS